MDYEKFLKDAMEIYNNEQSIDPCNYELDQEQEFVFKEAYEFFEYISKKYGGSVEEIDLPKGNLSKGLTAHSYLYDLYGNDLQRFIEVISDAYSVSMDADIDGMVNISIIIPGVYKRVDGSEDYVIKRIGGCDNE